ncbi:hypothetical protein GS921_25280 [Rhodococcus hoagii]|nr:hypothetical protein [Prescottella equi]
MAKPPNLPAQDRIIPPEGKMPVYLEVPNPLFQSTDLCIWVEPIRIYAEGLEFTFHLSVRDPDPSTPEASRLTRGLGSDHGVFIEIASDLGTAHNDMDFRNPPASSERPWLIGHSAMGTAASSHAVYYYSPCPSTGTIAVRMTSSELGLDSIVLELDARAIADCLATRDQTQ